MKRLHDVAGKLRHLHGWKRGRVEDHRDLHLKASWIDLAIQPTRASLRGSSALVVEDQGSIGSCTCNCSTSALEWALSKINVSIALSRLYAYARVRQMEGTPLTEDNGAEIRNVMKVLAQPGAVPEVDWPYLESAWNQAPPETLDPIAAKHRATFYYRCGTLRTIKASIIQGFPVVGGFAVPANMMTPECAKTGIVKFPGPTEGFEGGHAVLFVGYDNKTGLLEFMNSWGEGWGDKGFGYLPEEFVTQGLAADFWTIRRGEEQK